MRLRSATRSLRTRSNSFSGKVAFFTRSDTIAMAVSQCVVSVSVEITTCSRPAVLSIRAPRNSNSSAICWLDRVEVPSVSMEAVRWATPGLSDASVTAPASTTRPIATSGTPLLPTCSTFSPFASLCRRGTAGENVPALAAPGMTVRSTTLAEALICSSGSTDRWTRFSPSTSLAARRISSEPTSRYRRRSVLTRPGSPAITL